MTDLLHFPEFLYPLITLYMSPICETYQNILGDHYTVFYDTPLRWLWVAENSVLSVAYMLELQKFYQATNGGKDSFLFTQQDGEQNRMRFSSVGLVFKYNSKQQITVNFRLEPA